MRRTLALVLASTFTLTTALAQGGQVLPYDDEQPVPVGHHLETRPRLGLAITGGALLATGATFFAYGWSYRQSEIRKNDASEDAAAFANPGSGGEVLMWTGGVIAAVGVPLLLAGIFAKKTVLVRDDLAVAPVITPAFGGLSLSARF